MSKTEITIYIYMCVCVCVCVRALVHCGCGINFCAELHVGKENCAKSFEKVNSVYMVNGK